MDWNSYVQQQGGLEIWSEIFLHLSQRSTEKDATALGLTTRTIKRILY